MPCNNIVALYCIRYGDGAAPIGADSLAVIFFDAEAGDKINQFKRVKEEMEGDPVSVSQIPPSERARTLSRCIFFLHDSLDVALVDHKGYIRGNYIASDRDDIDRLLTEITIILRKY